MAREDSLNNFELMVMLTLIRLGENAYGVPIAQEIEQRWGRDVSIGAVYAALERSEMRGYVRSELGESTAERGGRAKKYFKVTAKGLREVRDARQTLVKFWKDLPGLEGGKPSSYPAQTCA